MQTTAKLLGFSIQYDITGETIYIQQNKIGAKIHREKMTFVEFYKMQDTDWMKLLSKVQTNNEARPPL